MEHYQIDLFQTGAPGRKKSRNCGASDGPVIQECTAPERQVAAAPLDGHMTDLLSAYITRLPDNATRKFIARQLINFIIKSANL